MRALVHTTAPILKPPLHRTNPRPRDTQGRIDIGACRVRSGGRYPRASLLFGLVHGLLHRGQETALVVVFRMSPGLTVTANVNSAPCTRSGMTFRMGAGA